MSSAQKVVSLVRPSLSQQQLVGIHTSCLQDLGRNVITQTDQVLYDIVKIQIRVYAIHLYKERFNNNTPSNNHTPYTCLHWVSLPIDLKIVAFYYAVYDDSTVIGRWERERERLSGDGVIVVRWGEHRCQAVKHKGKRLLDDDSMEDDSTGVGGWHYRCKTMRTLILGDDSTVIRWSEHGCRITTGW